MTLRYFEIRAPRADFTGHIGGVAFADGVARVSFDDARVDGVSVIDEHRVQVGRSAVLFAQRRPGYVVTEVDATGQPLTAAIAPVTGEETAPGGKAPARSAPKADWVRYAVASGMPVEEAEKTNRDDLAEKYLGPKES